ncbi:MAG: hypothetical protein NTU49_08740 [Gammaproteobacteria bacterium]|nr:hypothetical protein [Gammaproteobacteria bacterium]
MDKISSVITITLGTIGISLGGTALGQSVTVTPSGADSSNISTQTPVTIYCDTQTTPAATITSSASTGSASCATTLNVYYEIIPGQCSLCAVPTSSFSGAEGTAVGGGCAVVGSSTALNLSPVSTFTSNTTRTSKRHTFSTNRDNSNSRLIGIRCQCQLGSVI